MSDGSRLTSLGKPPAPAGDGPGPLRFRKAGKKILVSNEWGGFAVVERAVFDRLVAGALRPGDRGREELEAADLVRTRLDFEGLAADHAEQNLFRWPGPMVHTVVVTQRCNLRCLYCHASVVGLDARDKDMTLETARRVVDFIFSTPNPELMIEFQGGEPLLNWDVVRFVSAYARRRAEAEARRVHIGLISNFTLLDEGKLEWLASKKVSFCTSLDGPADLHEKNRLFVGGTSHAAVTGWIRRLLERRAAGLDVDKPNAIATVTRFSLDRAEHIVDQVAALGLERVQLGPLDPLGFARRSWKTIGYTPAEFCAFYRRALDRVLERWRKGDKIYEKMALILLIRILRRGHWRFPNADGLGRLAYNHDGGIYVSEEGRLVANEGDPFFRVGEAGKSRYRDVLGHPVFKATVLAGNRAAQPLCSQCAYAPYCTVLPVQNYRGQGSLWGRMPSNHWCETLMGVFDILFEKLEDKKSRAVFEAWLEEFSDK